MTEIKALWDGRLLPFPEQDIAAIREAAEQELIQVCCCFWLFRCLHRQESPAAVLLGDYSFGRFSGHLAALDSVSLTDSFAGYLKTDTMCRQDLDSYLAFVRQLPEIIRHEDL